MTVTTFVPPDPNYEARVREVMRRQGAMNFIGATMELVTPGRCTLEVPYRDELSQQHGFFHAGITSTLADTAGGYAGLTLFPAGSDVLTVEFKINLIAPAHGDRLVAEGRVVRSGRTLTICTIDVSAVRGGEHVPCAIMQQTLIRIDQR